MTETGTSDAIITMAVLAAGMILSNFAFAYTISKDYDVAILASWFQILLASAFIVVWGLT